MGGFDLSTLKPIEAPKPPAFDLDSLKPLQPATPPVPNMAQVPGAVPGTPPPTAAPSPTRLLDVAAAYPGTIPSKVPLNWTGKPEPIQHLGLPEAAQIGTALVAPGTIMPGRLDTSPAETVGRGVREMGTPGERVTGALRTAAGAAEAAAPLAGPLAVENPGTFVRGAAEGYLGGKAAQLGTKAAGGTEEQQQLAEEIGQMAPILAHAALHPEISQGHTAEGNPAVQGTVAGKFGGGIEITPDEFVVRGGSVENPKEIRIPRRPTSPKPAIEAPTMEGQQAEPKPVHHTSNDVEDLRASAERQAPKVGDAVAAATEGVPGAKVEAVRDSKDTDRIVDKAERQGVHPSQIGDIAAAKVTVPDQQAADKVLENLHQKLPVESKEGTVTGEPGNNAVRQTQAIVHTGAPEGEPVKKAEVLLQTPEMHAATEQTHDDYRKAQELRAAGKEAEAQAIEGKIAERHNAAEQEARQRLEAKNEPVQIGSATALHGGPQEKTGEGWSQPARVGAGNGLQQPSGESAQGTQTAGQKEEGFDFDGTLFREHADGTISEPIPERIAELKQRIADGDKIIIESRRAKHPGEVENIQNALASVGLPRLPVTPKKTAAPVLVDDKIKREPGVKVEHVATNADTPLPPEPGIKARGPGQAPIPPRRLADVARPERDTNIMARLEREHPEWSLSRRLQEAAAIANPAGGKSLASKTEEATQPQSTGGGAPVPVKAENQPAGVQGTGETPKYKFGNTQAPIHPDSEAAKALDDARARISPNDLAGNGKEIGDGGNHVTVRYGIQGDDTAKIKEFLSKQAPFEASLGKTEKFPPSEHSDGAAVIVAPIEAKELHRLNSEIEKHGDFTEPSFPEYKPHATVAYVDPSKADRYTGMSVTAGKKFTVDRVAITDRNGNAETVKLEGKKAVERPAGSAPVPPKKELELIKARIAELEAKKAPVPPVRHEGTTYQVRVKEVAERLRKSADAMDKHIENGRRPMEQNPTPKRMAQYRSRVIEADDMERTQKAMRALADAHEAGTISQDLAGLRSKDEIGNLVHKGLDSSKGGYYDRIPRSDYRDKSPAGKKLQEMIEGAKSPEATAEKLAKEKASKISQLEADVQFRPLPGYFPTPKAVVTKMLDAADIKPGMRVLEPSAGKGNIADAIRERVPDARLNVVEQAPKLQEILTLKDHNLVDSDFLQHDSPYDRIVMNPPFEKNADIEHVRHAFDLLKPGGRLVAIMSPHAEFANDKKSVEFRNWVESLGGESEKLPESSFKESGTGVNSRMVTIDKPEKTEPVVAKPATEEPTKAEKTFATDLNKKVSDLRKQIKEVEKEVSAPAAYFQDSAKNASERLKRASRNQKLSDLKSELREIEQAHKYDLAEKLTPEKEVSEEGKNFEGRYVRASLEPVKEAWVKKWPQAKDNTDTPEEHWKWLVKNGGNADKPAEFPKGHLYIKVPDDGSFYIPNNPAAIDHALKAAGKFTESQASQSLPKVGAKKFRMTSPKEFDNAKYIAGLEKEIKELGGEMPFDKTDLHYPHMQEQLKAARENLAEAKAGEKAETLISGESGELKPGELAKVISEAAGTAGNYVREVARATELARGLQRGLSSLDTSKEASILRAKETFEKLNKEGLTHAADEALYHHAEDSKLALSPAEKQWLSNVGQPIEKQNTEFFKELTEGGVPIENYVSRSVKDKGGMLDRIAKGVKAVGKKGTLSKAAPQTKTRTMMAIENPDGDRRVVSIKDGKATMWENGEPTELGEIKRAEGKTNEENETWPDGEPNSAFFDKGKVVEGPDGYDWKITQATTKEIEANTGLEYYHSYFAGLLASNIQLGAAVRAMRFLEAFKASPEFKEISWQGSGNPPAKWKAVSLPQFRNVYFEPRTAEVLDDYAERLKGGDFGVLQTIQSFLRAAYLINPIVHPMNVAASWAMEKGISGLAPWKWKTIYSTGTKAIKAVLEQNDDFKEALEAGGALQSHRAAIQEMHKLFFDRLAEGLEKDEGWAMKTARALGIEKGNLLNLLHKPSSIAAWTSSDIMYLQAAYQYQDEHPNTSLWLALKEVGRTIPEYRVPTRILDSHMLSKAMTNPIISWFGAYHYSLLHSFGQAAKSALGAQAPAAGRTKAEEVAKGWDRLALLGLITFALFPYVFDKAAKKLTGNEHARLRRPGPMGILDAGEQVEQGKMSAGAAAQKVFTPSPISKATAELLSDRELFSGRQIYDPHANWNVQGEQVGRYLMSGIGGQYGQYSRAETSDQKHRFWWQQAGVQFGKTRAEKIAQDIAIGKTGTAAEDPADQANRVRRREILDQMREGNNKPFEQAREKRELTHRQVLDLERRAKLSPLEDTIHGFSIPEVEKVLEAAKKDNDPKEIEQIQKVLRQKRVRAREHLEAAIQ